MMSVIGQNPRSAAPAGSAARATGKAAAPSFTPRYGLSGLKFTFTKTGKIGQILHFFTRISYEKVALFKLSIFGVSTLVTSPPGGGPILVCFCV